jgi:hypothetical protein
MGHRKPSASTRAWKVLIWKMKYRSAIESWTEAIIVACAA